MKLSFVNAIITISNLFSVDLTTTFTKQCKANSCQYRIPLASN